MAKFQLALAMPFLIGGIVVGLIFSLLDALGNMEAGMSATSVHGGPSISSLVFCVEVFFALGAAACLPMSLLARRVLAAVAYFMLLFGVLYLHHIGLPFFNIATLGIFLIAVIYASFWVPLVILGM